MISLFLHALLVLATLTQESSPQLRSDGTLRRASEASVSWEFPLVERIEEEAEAENIELPPVSEEVEPPLVPEWPDPVSEAASEPEERTDFEQPKLGPDADWHQESRGGPAGFKKQSAVDLPTKARPEVAEARRPAEALRREASAASSPLAAARALPDRSVSPPYPALARRRGWSGDVLLELLIAATGEVKTVKVVRSSGHGILDRAAVRAIQSWRFDPAKRGGRAVDSTLRHVVEFRLE